MNMLNRGSRGHEALIKLRTGQSLLTSAATNFFTIAVVHALQPVP
jgi:hypothetical protein